MEKKKDSIIGVLLRLLYIDLFDTDNPTAVLNRKIGYIEFVDDAFYFVCLWSLLNFEMIVHPLMKKIDTDSVFEEKLKYEKFPFVIFKSLIDFMKGYEAYHDLDEYTIYDIDKDYMGCNLMDSSIICGLLFESKDNIKIGSSNISISKNGNEYKLCSDVVISSDDDRDRLDRFIDSLLSFIKIFEYTIIRVYKSETISEGFVEMKNVNSIIVTSSADAVLNENIDVLSDDELDKFKFNHDTSINAVESIYEEIMVMDKSSVDKIKMLKEKLRSENNVSNNNDEIIKKEKITADIDKIDNVIDLSESVSDEIKEFFETAISNMRIPDSDIHMLHQAVNDIYTNPDVLPKKVELVNTNPFERSQISSYFKFYMTDGSFMHISEVVVTESDGDKECKYSYAYIPNIPAKKEDIKLSNEFVISCPIGGVHIDLAAIINKQMERTNTYFISKEDVYFDIFLFMMGCVKMALFKYLHPITHNEFHIYNFKLSEFGDRFIDYYENKSISKDTIESFIKLIDLYSNNKLPICDDYQDDTDVAIWLSSDDIIYKQKSADVYQLYNHSQIELVPSLPRMTTLEFYNHGIDTYLHIHHEDKYTCSYDLLQDIKKSFRYALAMIE